MAEIIRPNTREEWLEIRKQGIGSSEVATILGLNPFETPYELWLQKTGKAAPKQENFAMKAGHYLEDAVAQFWHDETGREIIKRSATDWLIRDEQRPYLQVSPDRTYWLNGEKRNNVNKGILECKTTMKSIDENDIPKNWFCQVQYQLGVAGLQHGSLAWLTAGREFGWVDIEFNADFFNWMVEQVEKFWTENVLGGIEPAPIRASDILAKYSQHTGGKFIEVADEVYETYKQLKDVNKEIKALEERKTAYEDTIKVAIADAEGATYSGTTLATWKSPAKPTMKFDTDRFKEEHPELVEQYTTAKIGARRFILK